MTQPQRAARRITKTALWGACAAAIAAVALVVASFVFFFGVAQNWSLAESEILKAFRIEALLEALNVQQRWVLGILLMAPHLCGLGLFYVATRLFLGLRRNEVFSEVSARRVRTIGWLIFGFAPARILSLSLGTAYAGITATPPMGKLSLSLYTMDFYAVVIGLLCVALGHIMTQAVDLSNENRSFV